MPSNELTPQQKRRQEPVGINELVAERPLGGISFPLELEPYKDRIRYFSRTGLPRDVYILADDTLKLAENVVLPTNIVSASFRDSLTDLANYLNYSPYLIFNNDVDEVEMEAIRKQMEEDKDNGHPEASYFYESSKLRLNNIVKALKASEILLASCQPLVKRLDAFNSTDIVSQITKFFGSASSIWKKEKQGKASSDVELSSLPWPKIFDIYNSMCEYSEKLSKQLTNEPFTYEGKAVNEDLMEQVHELVWMENNSCNYNTDKKVVFILHSFSPLLRRVLATIEVYLEMVRSGENLTDADIDGVEAQVINRLDESVDPSSI